MVYPLLLCTVDAGPVNVKQFALTLDGQGLIFWGYEFGALLVVQRLRQIFF